MNTTTRISSPESYATFWEPLMADGPLAPAVVIPAPEATAKGRDAYLEFTEITEGVPALVRVRR